MVTLSRVVLIREKTDLKFDPEHGVADMISFWSDILDVVSTNEPTVVFKSMRLVEHIFLCKKVYLCIFMQFTQIHF